MKERKYYSVIDNGRDLVGVTYYSFYRANSRQNTEKSTGTKAHAQCAHVQYEILIY